MAHREECVWGRQVTQTMFIGVVSVRSMAGTRIGVHGQRRALNTEIDIRVGCLALMRDAGAASCEVTAAVHGAVTRFCTRGMRHPGMNNMRRNSDPSEEIQEHIRHKIEIFTTDGAANEQLAGKLLHPTSLRGDLKVTLPNMRWLSETKLARQGGPLNEHSIKTL